MNLIGSAENVSRLFRRARGRVQTPPTREVTDLLLAWGGGDRGALEKLIPMVYGELRRLADRHLRRHRPDQTLQTTALVHEAYLRLVDQKSVSWQNRAHFYGAAANLMRQILVDHARRHHAAKRGGGAATLSFDEVATLPSHQDADLLAVDQPSSRGLETLEALGLVVDPQRKRPSPSRPYAVFSKHAIDCGKSQVARRRDSMPMGCPPRTFRLLFVASQRVPPARAKPHLWDDKPPPPSDLF